MNFGFSLLELLLVLVLIGIVLSLGIPGYRALLRTTQLTEAVEQLVGSIYYARSEAIKRHYVVALCKSKNGFQCGGRWQDGWIVFIDKQIHGRVETDDVILRRYSALAASQVLRWRGSRSHDYLQLDPNGATHGQNGSFIFSYKGHKKSERVVIISQTGRVRIEG